MQSKSLLIAIAAFAVTATGAQAYTLNTKILSSQQRAAFEEARELREKGEKEKARDVLIKAGVDEETLNSLRKANKESRQAIRLAVEENDYEAFKQAAEDTPLIDIITSLSDFQLFVQAHELRSEGRHQEAKEILEDLGLPAKPHAHHRVKKERFKEIFVELTEEQKEAFRAAKEANDKETMKAILREAGVIDRSHRSGRD